MTGNPKDTPKIYAWRSNVDPPWSAINVSECRKAIGEPDVRINKLLSQHGFYLLRLGLVGTGETKDEAINDLKP